MRVCKSHSYTRNESEQCLKYFGANKTWPTLIYGEGFEQEHV